MEPYLPRNGCPSACQWETVNDSLPDDQQGSLELEIPHGSSHSPKTGNVQEALGQCSQIHGLTLTFPSVEFGSIILMGLFQLTVFSDFVNPLFCFASMHSFWRERENSCVMLSCQPWSTHNIPFCHPVWGSKGSR